MKSMKLSNDCIAWLDGVRCIRLDGRSIRALYPGRSSFFTLLKCDSREHTKVAFDLIVSGLRCDDDTIVISPPDARPDDYLSQAVPVPGYIVYDDAIMHMDGVCLVSSGHRSSSVTIRYKDGCVVTMRFDDCAAAIKAREEIARAVDGAFGRRVTCLCGNGDIKDFQDDYSFFDKDDDQL